MTNTTNMFTTNMDTELSAFNQTAQAKEQTGVQTIYGRIDNFIGKDNIVVQPAYFARMVRSAKDTGFNIIHFVDNSFVETFDFKCHLSHADALAIGFVAPADLSDKHTFMVRYGASSRNSPSAISVRA